MWGWGVQEPPFPPPPPYLRPTVVRNHEQRPELARQAGRPGDMDQRDRAGEPKQLWSPNTETHSILSLLACSLSLSPSLTIYLSPRHQIASQRAPPFQSRLNLPLTTNPRGNENARGEMHPSLLVWCVGVSVGSNSFIFGGRSLSCLTWWKRISGQATLTIWRKSKTPHHLEGEAKIDL